MTDLLYIIENTKTTPEGTVTECVKQTDFEIFLKKYTECRLNAIVKDSYCTGRTYHIEEIQKTQVLDENGINREISSTIEIAKIKAKYRPGETEVLIEGRKKEEVLAILKKRNGFTWEEKDKHRKPDNTYTRTNTMEDIAYYIHSM